MPFQLDVALEPAAKGAWNLILDLEIAPGIGWSRRARRTSQPCRRHLWQGFPLAGALVQPLETTVTLTRNPEEGCQVGAAGEVGGGGCEGEGGGGGGSESGGSSSAEGGGGWVTLNWD